MSLSICIFFNAETLSVAEWQRGIDTLHLPLILSTEDGSELPRGYLPAKWNNKEAGFECSFDDSGEPMELYSEIDLGGSWLYMMELFYRTFSECVGAAIAAAGFVRVTGGVVYEPEENTVFDADGAAEYARELMATIPDIEARFERGDFRA